MPCEGRKESVEFLLDRETGHARVVRVTGDGDSNLVFGTSELYIGPKCLQELLGT
jgi:hypothetical protein